MLPLVSGINSRLFFVNHALISPILTHLGFFHLLHRLTTLIVDSLPPHCFIPGLKIPFPQILPTVSVVLAIVFHCLGHSKMSMMMMTMFPDFSEHIRFFQFLVFLFSTFFSFRFRAVFERTLKQLLVSYRIVSHSRFLLYFCT